MGLFIPRDLNASSTVFFAEGESDTAALLTMGVEAIGRPGATLCIEHAVRLVRLRSVSSVVVVADRGPAGEEGARRLAQQLALAGHSVRVITPPAKDAREWLRNGATGADLAALVAEAQFVTYGALKRGGLA